MAAEALALSAAYSSLRAAALTDSSMGATSDVGNSEDTGSRRLYRTTVALLWAGGVAVNRS